MQIMVEGLALAAFGFMHQMTTEPLLKQLLRYVMSDEARHVAFGVLSLKEYYAELTDAELRERQEFAFEAAVRMRDRFLQQEVWERMGVPVSEALEIVSRTPDQLMFQQMLFAKIVPNCRKLGLLDASDGWLRDRFTELGVIEFEHLDRHQRGVLGLLGGLSAPPGPSSDRGQTETSSGSGPGPGGTVGRHGSLRIGDHRHGHALRRRRARSTSTGSPSWPGGWSSRATTRSSSPAPPARRLLTDDEQIGRVAHRARRGRRAAHRRLGHQRHPPRGGAHRPGRRAPAWTPCCSSARTTTDPPRPGSRPTSGRRGRHRPAGDALRHPGAHRAQDLAARC